MKRKSLQFPLIPLFLTVFLAAGIALLPPHSFATTITGPLTLSQFVNLNTGASYGPPPAAHFFEPGPITVGSGVSADLFAGPTPGQANVDDLLFVLSWDSLASPSLGTVNFNIGSSIAPLGGIDFLSTDFFSTVAAGFPSNIGGIGNGEVNGIKFPSALHAGALFPFDGGFSADVLIDNVTVTTSVPLRVDIFGVDDGTIINNTPNSGSLGVVPEPATMLLLGSGLAGLAAVRRKMRKK